MILGFPNGFSPSDTFDTAEKVEAWFYATDALTVGTGVMIDFGAGSNAGKRVLQATVANDHDMAGLYEGFGFPTGAKSTITGLTGKEQKAAVAADIVRVTVYGPGVCRLSDTALATAGDPAAVTTGGVILRIATAAGCGNAGFILIGTATDAVVTATATATTSATCRVWCKLM